MRHSACECSERHSKSAVADFDINGAHRVSREPAIGPAKGRTRWASPMAGYVGQARLRWRAPTLAQGNALGNATPVPEAL